MNWHEPLITPATAFYCVVGLVIIDLLYLIVRKAMKDAGKVEPDQHQHEMLTSEFERTP